MPSKFKKKSVVVEASPWFKEGDHQAVVRAIKTSGGSIFCHDAISLDRVGEYALTYVTLTPDGEREVFPGDWIVTEENGISYPINHDNFMANYEGA